MLIFDGVFLAVSISKKTAEDISKLDEDGTDGGKEERREGSVSQDMKPSKNVGEKEEMHGIGDAKENVDVDSGGEVLENIDVPQSSKRPRNARVGWMG